MKTLLIVALFALNLSLSCAALGQSSFQLLNFDPSRGVNAPVFDAQGVPLAGPRYLAELWGGATPDSLTPLWIISQGSGREIVPFLAGGYFFSGSSFLSVTSVPPNGSAWLRVRAWDSRLGATYEQVATLAIGGYGESPLFYAQGHDPLREPPESGAPLIGLQSFSLQPVVPEPCTWALLALGGTALLWAARRRPQGRL